MEGTESGRTRPAPPSRWRRAFLGGRTDEQPELTDLRRSDPHPGAAGQASPPGVTHPEERVAPVGYPADYGYPSAPTNPAVSTHRPDVGRPDGGRQVAESRYAILDNGYSTYLSPPRVEPHRGTPPAAPHSAPPAVPTSRAVPRPRSAPPARAEQPWIAPPHAGSARVESAARAADPTRIEWRDGGPDPGVERAVEILRHDLARPRMLAFANPKGGVHKTTATVLAAAAVGSVRGRGVLAWDDNELRGTLGLRAGSARHARTIRHLVADLTMVEAQHGAGLTDRLDDYLRHASDGSYDVLAGEENPRFAQRLDQHTVRRVLELLRRTHDVICVDTGNNVESVNWQTVLQAADQLVVTTVPREDAAFAADWMLDLLHDIGMGDLVTNAVTLLSCPTPNPSPLLDDLRRHFATRTRAVAVVPYDPALESGSAIEYAQLRHETRQAWLKAAAVMVEPFAR